jgi:hypothetical protein
MHGFGVYTTADGKKKHCIWIEGKKEKTLTSSEVDELISGGISGKDMLGRSIDEWVELQSMTENYF